MTLISDPQLRAASRPAYAEFDASAGAVPMVDEPYAAPVVNEPHDAPVAVGRTKSGNYLARTLYVTVGLSAIVLALRLYAASIAIPLNMVSSTPAGGVSISAVGSKPVTAIMYTKRDGFHLIRVPARPAVDGAEGFRFNTDQGGGLLPAEFVDGDVRLFSLGLDMLHVYGVGSDSKGTFSANAPVVTVNVSKPGSGMRLGW